MAQDTTSGSFDKIRGVLELSRQYVPPEARQPIEESLLFVDRFLASAHRAENLIRHLSESELRQTLARLWRTERDVLTRAAARAGVHTVTPPARDEAPLYLAALLAALDEASGPAPARARRRGVLPPAAKPGPEALARLLGAPLSAEAVAARLGTTPAGVEARRAQGELLAMRTTKGSYAYPDWQFAESAIIPGLPEALRRLAGKGVTDPWEQASFFLSGNAYLHDRTPLDELRRRHGQAVLRAVEAYGEHGAA